MLSWSSNEAGGGVDLTGMASGDAVVTAPIGDRADALWRFASACAATDDAELELARSALIDESDEAFMVDAAAVAANFEMMTRLADSTGARLPAQMLEQRAGAIGALGLDDLVSRR